MICTITYNGKEYSEQEFKKLVEASFNNYKAAQTEQNSIEAYNTVMKQADALLGFLNQYNVQLDEDEKSFEPKEISEEGRKEITKQLMKIDGLDNNHFNYFANYVSETAAKSFNANAESITNEGTLKASMKKELESMLDGYEANLDKIAEKLNLIGKPDDKVVQLNLKKIQVAKEKLKLVKDNFDMIADVGLQKLYKFANIKVNTITNEDGTTETKVEEADDTSRIADMEEELSEDSITDFEEINSERDESYSQTSLEKNPKNSVRKELRMLMRGIPLTDKDGNPMNTVMGIPAFVEFDTVFDTVIALMADKSFTFDEAIAHLKDNADVRPWMNEFISRLEKADSQIKNQFLHVMGNHALTMHFVQYSFDKDGNLTAKVMNTNSAELRRKTLTNWRNEFLGSDLVDADAETGQYFANKNEALRLLEEYKSWTTEAPEDLKFSGTKSLLDLHTQVVNRGKDLEVKDGKTIKKLGFNPDDFKEGEVKKYLVNNKIGDKYDSKELRVKKINGELKYILGKPTTPAISRALKVKSILVDGKPVPVMEYSNMSIDEQAEAVETVLTWLDSFGIDMHPNAIHRILSGQYYVDKNTKLTPDKFFASTDNAHQPIGILADWLQKVVNSDSMVISPELEDNHPFRDNAIENGLARFQAKYVENVATSSFRSGKKSIYGYTAYKYVTDRFIDLKNNTDGIREQLGSLAFSKNSAWLQLLGNTALPNAFNISHLDLNALKEAGKKIFKDNGITNLADADHELVKLLMFMDMKQGSTKVTYSVDGIEFPMRIASMLFPTMSDKSTEVIIKTPMFKLNNSDYYTYNPETQKLEANAEILKLVFNQLVLPEIERIVDSNGKTTDIKGYDKGKQMLMFLPKLNDLNVSYELNDGSLWEGSLKSLLNSSSFTMDNLNDELKAQIYPEISKYLSELVSNKMKVWKENELATVDESGESKLKFFDTAYVTDTDKKKELTNDTKLNIIAFDYVINQMIGNVNAFMTIIGDPALYYKADSKESYIEQSKETFTNVGKRLAAMIAPGSKLAESKNETYHQVFLADRISVSQNIGFLTKVLDGKEFNVEEYNKIMKIEDKGEREKALNNLYPKSAGYFNIESTDAQEYTTWQEHLHILKQMGKTSDKVLSLTSKDLEEAEKIFTENIPFEKMTDAQKEILSKVLQPIKPVYTGQIYDKEQGVMRMMYIKSSSFPLIPQMTAGTELDKLRIALQDFQKGGFVRASYQTANKVGALSAPLEIFDSNGKIKNITQKELESASLVLNRKDFKIQQDVPFKSGKRSEDTTTLGSQLTKVLFGNGMMDESGFIMDGTSYSGKKLQEIYNETFIELYNLKKQKLYNELGIDEKTNLPIDVKETALKLQKLLREEALDRGWSKQQIDGLEIEFVYEKEKIVDYKFKLPLWMSANSDRIEALLNAVVNNRLVKMKLPGNAYVAGSEEGFKIQNDFTGIDKSQIVWLNNQFNGELQAANYDEKNNLKSAQILVASKFRDNDGNLIDLLEKDGENYKYVIKTDKGFQLNEKMFTKELLDMITFRIPTSGHMSGSKVTIAGFLPSQNGDLIITPKNFTKQMGQDFDIDKLSSYQLWHTQDEDGKFRPIKAGDKVKNIKEKLLQNKLVNIHLAVFGNSRPSVQKKINTILSTDYAEDQAKMIDNVNSSANQYFTPLSDEYQKQKMFLGASGKIGTGAYSLDVTSHSLFEQAKANGKQLELMNNGLPFKMSFGSISTSGKLGEANAKVVSKKDYFVARLNNLNGNDTVLDNLSELLKSDEKTGLEVFKGQTENYPELKQILDDYNNLQRSIAEVLSERQNIAVDNEKLQVMGKVNLNSYTMDVDKVLCMLGFDKGEDGNSISFLFLSQPIIKDYVAEMSKATSNIKGYNPNAEAEVIKKLHEKYFDGDTLKILEDAQDAYEFDNKYGSRLTTSEMYNELTKKITKDRTDNHLQLVALNRFLMLKQYGLALRSVQSAINTDSKGLGKSIPEVGEKIKSVTALVSNSFIKNAQQLLGDYLMTDNLTQKEYDEKIKEGFIPVTNQLMIKPTTSVGAVSLNALVTANNLWEKHFPYNKDSINKAITEVMELVSKSEASEAKKAEKQHMILKEIKKYFNARMTQENLIKSGTATEERYRLMYDDKKTNKVSLAKYLSNTVNKFPQLKNNKLIQRFTYDIDYTGKPSMILYENTAGANFDEEGLNNALLELLGTDLVLPTFNGEIYSAKKLAQDLINYALLEGGVQEATQFAKFIPMSYLEQMGFNKSLNKINYDTTTLFGFRENGPSDFAIQFARNNPTSLPKLLMEESKANKVLSSNIPITNAGYNSNNAPNFIAHRVKGKDYLWMKVGNEYKPLSVAVSKGNQGQKVFAYDINPNQQQRQISKGKVRDVAPPPVNETKNDDAASKLVNQERFGLGQDNFITILTNIVNSNNLPANITTILKQLISKVDPNTVIKVVDGLESNGTYQKGVIQINRQYAQDKETSDEMLARTILKETVHSVTDQLILNHTDSKGQLEPKDGVPGAKAAREIIALYKRAQTALSTGKYAAKYKSMLEKFERLQQGEKVGFDPEEKRILYGTVNIKEFIEMIMTQPEFQQAMSEIKVGSSNTTLMDKLRNFIKSVLEAIGIEEGTLTDDAIKNIFQLIEESKPTQTQLIANTQTESNLFSKDEIDAIKGNYLNADDLTIEQLKTVGSPLSLKLAKLKEDIKSASPFNKADMKLKAMDFLINNEEKLIKELQTFIQQAPEVKPTTTSNLPGPETKINIYAGTGENAELSNFAYRPFTEDNLTDLDISPLGLPYREATNNKSIVFNTVEGHYQANKILYSDSKEYWNDDYEFTPKAIKLIEEFAKATGAQAKSLGQTIKGLDKETWNSESSDRMKESLYLSFKQNPDALAKLLATGNATLTHTQDKGKWGTEFPKLLMEVREELKGQQPTTTTQPSTEVVAPGIEIKRDALNEQEQLELFNILMPYLQSQAAKTNKGSSANLMIGLNLRWDYKSNNPNQEAVNIDKTINNSEHQRNKYGYYELSVNGQPLGPIDQRIKDLISKATGIDATNYDGAIINLYDDKTFISAHNDVDESATAIGYPVLVVNIGGSGNFSVEGAKKSNNYSSKVYEDKLLNAGDAYVFGVDGKNRDVYHRTFASSVKGFLPELTIDNENVKKTFPKGSYRISITLRRVMDLEPDMPKTPAKISPTSTIQPSTSEKSFTTKVDQFTYTYNPVTKQVIHNAKAGDKVETNETQINKVLAAYAKANNFETKVFNKQEYVQIDNKILNVNTGSRVTQKEIVDLFTVPIQQEINLDLPVEYYYHIPTISDIKTLISKNIINVSEQNKEEFEKIIYQFRHVLSDKSFFNSGYENADLYTGNYLSDKTKSLIDNYSKNYYFKEIGASKEFTINATKVGRERDYNVFFDFINYLNNFGNYQIEKTKLEVPNYIQPLSKIEFGTQTDLNQKVYNKVKTNLAALINTENQLLNDNPEQVTFPDEIDYSQFNGYPKIVKFLNEASVTDNQLKFFSAHQDYVEALLNESNATDMDELLEAIGEKEVEPEPTESQIEFGMSDSTIADIENELAETDNMISESKAGEIIELFPGVYANKGQTQAIEKLNSFVKDKGRQVFVLKGRGGTGKTTIIKKILEGLKRESIAAATISHKAKGVLQISMGNEVQVGTIASAIGLKPKRNNPSVFEKDPKFKKEKSPFYNAGVIIIDECSMLTQEMVTDIINFSRNPNVKIIFMGDNVQLPPIEENASLQNKDSVSFTANTKPEYTATLTERMRQGEDSPIVVLSDIIAANVESTTPELRVITDRRNKFDEKKNKGTLFETKTSMVPQLTKDLQSDKENTKIICFTNAEKDSMNNLAREILWGEGNTNEFNKGEILINEDTKEKSLVASTDIFNGEQYVVLNSTPVNIKFNKLNNDFSTSVVSLPGYSLRVQNESGEMVTIQVLSPKVKQKYAELQKNNADLAFRVGGASWDVYWGNEDQHVKSDYGYAITSHKSQGSTYNNVYVMEDNILGVQDASVKTKNQSLYVAVTRPRHKAVIVSNKNASNALKQENEGAEHKSFLKFGNRGKSFEPKEISEEDINNLPKIDCE